MCFFFFGKSCWATFGLPDSLILRDWSGRDFLSLMTGLWCTQIYRDATSEFENDRYPDVGGREREKAEVLEIRLKSFLYARALLKII